jgi:hypothetical protein
MPITPSMLLNALDAAAYETRWLLHVKPNDRSQACIDGWFDLTRMSEFLNQRLNEAPAQVTKTLWPDGPPGGWCKETT